MLSDVSQYRSYWPVLFLCPVTVRLLACDQYLLDATTVGASTLHHLGRYMGSFGNITYRCV